jgi:hypothetical protein
MRRKWCLQIPEEAALEELQSGDSASSLATPAADTTFTPKQKQKAPAPIQVDTPHNTAAVQSHVVAVLDELDSLQFRVFPLTTVAGI